MAHSHSTQYVILRGIPSFSLTWLGLLCTSCYPYSTKPRQQRRGLDTLCGKAIAFLIHCNLLTCCIKGVTVYRALKYSRAKIGEWVVLPGAGGGLGHLGLSHCCS
jgi:hypothetical protein